MAEQNLQGSYFLTLSSNRQKKLLAYVCMVTTSAESDVPKGNTYDKYESKNPVERYLMEGFFTCLNSALPTKAPENILEVGAGEGEVADVVRKRYPNANYVAIDLPSDELAGQWSERSLDGLFGNMENLPLPTASFDLVLAIEVFEHVDNPERCLTEIKRVGSSNFVCSVPREPIWRAANMARGKYIGDLGNTPGHINHWSSKAFEQLMATELTVKRTQRPFPWTMVSAHL